MESLGRYSTLLPPQIEGYIRVFSHDTHEERLPPSVCSTSIRSRMLLLCSSFPRVHSYRSSRSATPKCTAMRLTLPVQHQQLLSLFTRSCVNLSAYLSMSLSVSLFVSLPTQRCSSHTVYLLPRGLDSTYCFTAAQQSSLGTNMVETATSQACYTTQPPTCCK